VISYLVNVMCTRSFTYGVKTVLCSVIVNGAAEEMNLELRLFFSTSVVYLKYDSYLHKVSEMSEAKLLSYE
jgi:hypothetical protein